MFPGASAGIYMIIAIRVRMFRGTSLRGKLYIDVNVDKLQIVFPSHYKL